MRLQEFYWEITRVLLRDYKKDYKGISYKTCDRKKHVCLGVPNKFYSHKRVLRFRSDHKVVWLVNSLLTVLLTSLLSSTEFTLLNTEWCAKFIVSLYSVQRYMYPLILDVALICRSHHYSARTCMKELRNRFCPSVSQSVSQSACLSSEKFLNQHIYWRKISNLPSKIRQPRASPASEFGDAHLCSFCNK